MSTKLEFVDLKSQYAALKDRIAERMQRVLDHGQYIMGPEVAELEQRLAAYKGAKHCITVASGTEALLISLMALDLKPGDEVITTPFTFAATAEMIVLLGGVPVFVDIEPDSCNIDASLIEPAITPRTRAIMPVSLYGQCADMDAINAVASRHEAKYRTAKTSAADLNPNVKARGNVGFADGHAEFMSRKEALSQRYSGNWNPDPPGF